MERRNSKNPKTELEKDPRMFSSFRPNLFPKVEGKTLSTKEPLTGRSREKLRFAAVYYHLNMAYLGLLEARDKQLDETAALKDVEKILIVRDNLENEFTPLGFIPEPVVENGITVDLRFLAPPKFLQTVQSSVFASVPLPPGVSSEDVQ